EDHAPRAHEAVRTLAKKMLTLVDPACRTHRIEFEELNVEAARMLKGSGWKSTKPRDQPKLVAMRRAIATKLAESSGSVPGFVFFHVDGDTAWKERKTSEQPDKVAVFRAAVARLVTDYYLAPRGRSADLPVIMSRFQVLMPFHSIEAWLFQNTVEL